MQGTTGSTFSPDRTSNRGMIAAILYRLEDEGLICSQWRAQGRAAPKKVYTATEAGQAEWHRRQTVWREFCSCVDGFFKEEEP